ncbi:hypothetical protein GCM10009730_63030 [Streptomyces albidochromogenes]
MTIEPDTCSCSTPWPRLTAVIEQCEYTVTPTAEHSPASALYLAHCALCGALYTAPWKRTREDHNQPVPTALRSKDHRSAQAAEPAGARA